MDVVARIHVRLEVGAVCVGVLLLATAAFGQRSADLTAELNPEAVVKPVPEEIRLETKRLRDYGLPGFDKKITLTSIQPMEAVTVIEILQREGGLNNVVITKGVQGIATRLKFTDLSIADALEVMLSVNNLAYEVKDGVIKIMTDVEYREQTGSSFYDRKKVRIVDIKHADPTRVAKMIESLKSGIGTIVPDAVTGTIIIIDTPDKIREMQAVIDKADVATVARLETKTFVLQYASLDDIKAEVTTILNKEAGATVRTDKRTKTLIVTDLPQNLAKVQQLVSMFDKRSKQVFIEAKVVEQGLSDDWSLGVNWQQLLQGLEPRFSLKAASLPGGPATPVGALTYNTIVAGGDLQVVLEALKQVGSTEIISNPNVAVQDGQEAKIEVVEDQPYKEVQYESGTTNVTGVTYLFKKVGVQMAVTPHINEEGYVSVAIKPQISSISQWYDGAPQEGTPVIKTALAETTLTVKDGVTIIIGGMIKDREDKGTTSVPFLGSIPLLGRLFRYDSTSFSKTETIVFMTPRIITGDEMVPLLRDVKKEPKPMRSVGEGDAKIAKPVR